MSNHIEYIDFNIHGGTLEGRMFFKPGLNILSGENGTLKTKALQALKTGAVKFQESDTPCRRQAISPKRNAERREFRQIVQTFRQKNFKLENLINERNMNDGNFEDYPTLGGLYYVVFEDLCKDGSSRIERMEDATKDFNSVIQRIFPYYELLTEWSDEAGSPDIKIVKNGDIEVPLEGLSLGEQEVLSLAASIYFSKDAYDVFLVDEPEVHLNWHLEERLFEFFNFFCEEFDRQMIVVTHSRVVFSHKFFSKSQFLYWNEDGKVSFGDDVTPEQRKRIAGDAIEIIRFGAFSRPTFFVEDSCQEMLIEELAHALGAEINVTVCDNKSNVRALYKLAKIEKDWASSFFVEDGDNEGKPDIADTENFIHLEKYCMENYLLNPAIACGVLGISGDEFRQNIHDTLSTKKDEVFRKSKNKFFEFLFDHLKPEDLTEERLSMLDASIVLPGLLKIKDLKKRDFVQQFIHKAIEQNQLEQVLPVRLVAVINEFSQKAPEPEAEHGL